MRVSNGYNNDVIKHKSAGGFVFYKDVKTDDLFVALLCKGDGSYVIAKGHVKKDESLEEGAIREVMEELSLKSAPKIISFLGTRSYEFILDDGNTNHKDLYLYVFEVDKKEEISPLREEGFESAEWLKFEDAVDKISFYREELIEAGRFFSRGVSR